jgi:hypothetical protein
MSFDPYRTLELMKVQKLILSKDKLFIKQFGGWEIIIVCYVVTKSTL